MDQILQSAYQEGLKYTDQAKPADYIPELAKEDPSKVGLALVDKDGNLYSYGRSEDRFTIQSILKVVFYLMALEELGEDKYSHYIDVKPTALGFNSIMDLELADGRPRNPLVNAGAIATVGLLYGVYGDQTEDKIFDKLRYLSSDDTITYSKEVYESELATAYNNIAIVNIMEARDRLPQDIDKDEVLKIYIKACAALVNVVNLARLAGVIANDGTDPVSKEEKFDKKYARNLRTLMATCGMYNYSGEFALNVGLPAKSGVGGGIIASSKAGYGIATYCPGLDEFGNSLAGSKMLEYISDELDLYIY